MRVLLILCLFAVGCISPVAQEPGDDDLVTMYLSYLYRTYPNQSDYGVCVVYANGGQIRTLLPRMLDTIRVRDGAALTAKWNEKYNTDKWTLRTSATVATSGKTWQIQ
jgi:hypothetical protein